MWTCGGTRNAAKHGSVVTLCVDVLEVTSRCGRSYSKAGNGVTLCEDVVTLEMKMRLLSSKLCWFCVEMYREMQLVAN